MSGTCWMQKFLKVQIDDLRRHIKRDCLFGIPPGFSYTTYIYMTYTYLQMH